jgi:hypothetical protein
MRLFWIVGGSNVGTVALLIIIVLVMITIIFVQKDHIVLMVHLPQFIKLNDSFCITDLLCCMMFKGAIHPTSCGVNRTTIRTGSSRSSDCVCSHGTGARGPNLDCIDCPPDFYCEIG